MSSRFHQKYHRSNHHSVAPGTGSNLFPDSGFDPIASFSAPFQGEFYSNGDIITTQKLSAGQGLYVGNDVFFEGTTTLVALSVASNTNIQGNLVVEGDLKVNGTYTVLETTVATTSALEITNLGSGPALKITQSGIQPLAKFIDSEGSSIVFDNNSQVGIGTEAPEADLHLKREIGQPVSVRVEGDNPTLTLKNQSSRFDIINSFNGAVVFSTDSSGTINQELYKLKLKDNSDAVTVLSGGNVGIRTISPNKQLTVNGEISASRTITAPQIILTSPNIHSVVPTRSVVLPMTAVDIELLTTATAMITSFTGGIRGTLYTLTNTGTFVVTLSAALNQPRIYIRNGTAWKSNTYSLSTAYLQLPPNTSCSLRVGENDVVSVW